MPRYSHEYSVTIETFVTGKSKDKKSTGPKKTQQKVKLSVGSFFDVDGQFSPQEFQKVLSKTFKSDMLKLE